MIHLLDSLLMNLCGNGRSDGLPPLVPLERHLNPTLDRVCGICRTAFWQLDCCRLLRYLLPSQREIPLPEDIAEVLCVVVVALSLWNSAKRALLEKSSGPELVAGKPCATVNTYEIMNREVPMALAILTSVGCYTLQQVLFAVDHSGP